MPNTAYTSNKVLVIMERNAVIGLGHVEMVLINENTATRFSFGADGYGNGVLAEDELNKEFVDELAAGDAGYIKTYAKKCLLNRSDYAKMEPDVVKEAVDIIPIELTKEETEKMVATIEEFIEAYSDKEGTYGLIRGEYLYPGIKYVLDCVLSKFGIEDVLYGKFNCVTTVNHILENSISKEKLNSYRNKSIIKNPLLACIPRLCYGKDETAQKIDELIDHVMNGGLEREYEEFKEVIYTTVQDQAQTIQEGFAELAEAAAELGSGLMKCCSWLGNCTNLAYNAESKPIKREMSMEARQQMLPVESRLTRAKSTEKTPNDIRTGAIKRSGKKRQVVGRDSDRARPRVIEDGKNGNVQRR